MDLHKTQVDLPGIPQPDGSIPEDVAALYSWANLEDMKYHDFSGSRREQRAQGIPRFALDLPKRELLVQAKAEGFVAAVKIEEVEPIDPKINSAPDPGDTGQFDSGLGTGNGLVRNSILEGSTDFNFGISSCLEPTEEEWIVPAWLHGRQSSPWDRHRRGVPQAEGLDAFQNSVERFATRRFPLKSLFEAMGRELPAISQAMVEEPRAPLLLVFSLAGGVGKTSLVATLGRVLSTRGERVLLVDTASYSLLPFYFGGREQTPGTVRALPAPLDSKDEPIRLVSSDLAAIAGDERRQEALVKEIFHHARDCNRVLVDLSAGAGWLMRRLVELHPTVLVPLAPDINSVISLQAVERFFHAIQGADGRPLLPFYLLNQFDTSLPLHLDVREVLRRQLGDRLLDLIVRQSPAVSEALAEGQTVMEYAPEDPSSRDYAEIAKWLQRISPPAMTGFAEFERGLSA